MYDNEPLYPTERIGLAVYWLAQGGQFTPKELATRLGCTRHGAYQMLTKLSRTIPIVDDGGVWRVCHDETGDDTGAG